MEAGLLLQFCNWSTLVVCMVIKFPQIFALLSAKSSRGVSLKSLLLELTGFLVFLRYQSYYSYPLLTYLEYPILIAQDIVLLLCVFHYDGSMKQAIPYVAIFLGGWYFLTLQKWIIDLAMVQPCEQQIQYSGPHWLPYSEVVYIVKGIVMEDEEHWI
ncbi:solute carrier family 66 member 3 isoform X2 [Sarcophilus harrisii]|uniref:solute carrier family 66 member 3 isoform X2 n=1 Tax=Sarcophilus harrisii TaxID=9305 RepID=UPI001301C647|nr:solute carrier family 66 member 3 isoform X2 [Sarcophilus harrisii]